MSLVEIMVMVGILSIISLAIATISSQSSENLKHTRIGSDLNTLQTLVHLSLTRPKLDKETSVCRTALKDVGNYDGSKVEFDKIYDSSGNNVLVPINQYEVDLTAEISDKKDGPIDFDYPDPADGNKIKKFQFYQTELLIKSKKKVLSMGGDLMRARLGLGVITGPNPKTDIVDCVVNPTDFEGFCVMLGGQYDASKDPRCLFQRLAVAPNWVEVDKLNKQSNFRTGDVYAQGLLVMGDADNALKSILPGQRSRGRLDRGISVGGSQFNVGLGSTELGATGIAIDEGTESFFSIFAQPDGKAPFPKGYAAIRTYFARPMVFSTCDKFDTPPSSPPGAGCVDAATIKAVSTGTVMSATTMIHGAVISGEPGPLQAMIGGTVSAGTLNLGGGAGTQGQIGFRAHYNDNKTIDIGRSDDRAMGLMIKNDIMGSTGTKTLGGFYYALDFANNNGGTAPGLLVVKTYDKNDIVFQINNSAACTADCTPMVISGQSRVGIGTGLMVTPNAKLQVTAGAATNPGLNVTGTTEMTGATTINGATTIKGAVEVTGNIHATGVISADSDRRLKTEIHPITNALEKILKINGVYYKWKDPRRSSLRQVGVIAQEVEDVFPELVLTNSNGVRSVAYSQLVGPMIEAMKEQQAQIEELKKSRDQLEEKVDKLMGYFCRQNSADPLCTAVEK